MRRPYSPEQISSCHGLLVTGIGRAKRWPAAASSNNGTLYIGAKSDPAPPDVLLSNGTIWSPLDPTLSGIYLDLTDLTVRNVLRLAMIQQFEGGLWAQPDAIQVFATEPEDNQPNDDDFIAAASDKSWWLNYCNSSTSCSSKWQNDAYTLNGSFVRGQPNQPKQKWW